MQLQKMRYNQEILLLIQNMMLQKMKLVGM